MASWKLEALKKETTEGKEEGKKRKKNEKQKDRVELSFSLFFSKHPA